MPRYFFDVLNGGALHSDPYGIDLPSVRCIWRIAVTMVDDIAEAEHHLQPPDRVSVIVRDGSAVVVYRSDQFGRVRVPQTGKDTTEAKRAASASKAKE